MKKFLTCLLKKKEFWALLAFNLTISCACPEEVINEPEFPVSLIASDSKTIVNFINQHPDNVNAVTFNRQYSLLSYAVWFNKYELAELLIMRGANVNFRDSEGDNIAALVIQNPEMSQTQKKKFLQLLINNHINLNSQNRFEITPLIFAARHDLLQVAQLLIDNDANPTIKDGLNETALDNAKSPGMKKLLKKAEADWNKKHKK